VARAGGGAGEAWVRRRTVTGYRFFGGSGERVRSEKGAAASWRTESSSWSEAEAANALAALQQQGVVPLAGGAHPGAHPSQGSAGCEVEVRATFFEGPLGLAVVNGDESRDKQGLADGCVYVAESVGQAQRLGVQPGDQVIAYNGKPLRKV
jgi:hypothetical protein